MNTQRQPEACGYAGEPYDESVQVHTVVQRLRAEIFRGCRVVVAKDYRRNDAHGYTLTGMFGFILLEAGEQLGEPYHKSIVAETGKKDDNVFN